jgi:hypothetical protein
VVAEAWLSYHKNGLILALYDVALPFQENHGTLRLVDKGPRLYLTTGMHIDRLGWDVIKRICIRYDGFVVQNAPRNKV